MNEADFWVHLEYRVCRELDGMRDERLRIFSCDGFYAEQYLIDDPNPRITGLAWMDGGGLGQWHFTLVLPERMKGREALEWERLLPPDSVTRWLAIDQEHRHVEISPAAAIPHATLLEQVSKESEQK